MIGENLDSLISILTRIQSKYISQSELIQLSQSENIQFSQSELIQLSQSENMQLSEMLKTDDDKLQLAKKLYPKIHEIEPKLSVTVILQITKMILELDNEEILDIIKNDLLKEKIEESKKVLTECNFEF